MNQESYAIHTLNHVPHQFRHIFENAQTALRTGDAKAAAELFNTLPGEMAGYAATAELFEHITGRPFSGGNGAAQSPAERNEAATSGATAQSLMLPAESPMERLNRGYGVAPGDPGSMMHALSPVEASASHGTSWQGKEQGYAPELPQGAFEQFATEHSQAQQADNERQANRGAQFGDDFDAGLAAARAQDSQGIPWSTAAPYGPTPGEATHPDAPAKTGTWKDSYHWMLPKLSPA